MKLSISHLHLLCQDWTRELTFYKTEIDFFKNRLEEIVSKNTDTEVRAQADHFENKFRIINIHCDELLHDINLMNTSLSAQAMSKPNYINIKMIQNDENLEGLMEFTANDFNATKKEFHLFLAKNL